VKAIGKAAKGTQKNVSDWDKVQTTHNQQMSKWNAWISKIGINIGTALLPAVDQFTNHLIYGGHQWGQIFKSIGKWWGDTVNSFGHGAQQIGDFIAGIGRNFETGRKQIVGAFAGAGKWLTDAGRWVVQGLADGITGATHFITDAVNTVASLIPSGVRKLLGIASPSKVMHQLGTYIGQGLERGILGTAKQVQSATNTLSNMVIGMFEQSKGGISKRTESAALSTISHGTNALIAEANKRAAIGKQITAAQKKLTADLKAQKKASDASLKDSILSDGNITSFATTGDAIQGLHVLLGNTRRFKTDLQSLVKKGIDANTLKELIGAGVSGGGLGDSTSRRLAGSPALATYAGNRDDRPRDADETWKMHMIARERPLRGHEG
jgi:hypothetical protein